MADVKTQQTFSVGDVISRRYEVERVLGGGLLGTSYLVRHISTGKNMVVKVIHPSLVANPLDRKRFEDVFTSAAEVKHAGLVRLGEISEHAGLVYYTQEYFESQNLRGLIDAYLEERKVFSLEEACQIILQVLEATTALNDADMVHRNLKPENILVCTRATGPGAKNVVRTVKVTGAGLAAVVNPSIFAESYISRDEAAYLAPELNGFEQEGLLQSDVYSCGVMLYELLVGQTPTGTYLSPTQLRGDLPEHIDDIVELSLSADPEDRYPTPRDMLNDIQRSFSMEFMHSKTKRSYKNALIGVGIVLMLVILSGLYLKFGEQLGIREPADPYLDAQAMDERIRTEVLAETPQMTEAEQERAKAAHPEMLYVPGGPFVKGRLNQELLGQRDLDGDGKLDKVVASKSEPVAERSEVGAFYMDRFEYPNQLQTPQGEPAHAVAKVTWEQANEACETLGKRLCTEAEWEKACKGPGNYVYSYGDTYDEEICGEGLDGSSTIGAFKYCHSSYGVGDMSGGKREWTSTVYGSEGTRRVTKGGMRGNNERGSRCAFAVDEMATFADSSLAFRCCLDDDGAVTGAGVPANAEEAPPAAEDAPAQ